jgi:hypothetical protein
VTKERRLFPRYPHQAPVVVSHRGGERFSGETRDVSLRGLGVVLKRYAVTALAQGGSLLTPGDRVEVMLVPDVSGTEVDIGPTLPARVRYVRRLSQTEYHVGLWCDSDSVAHQEALNALVEQARRHQMP